MRETKMAPTEHHTRPFTGFAIRQHCDCVWQIDQHTNY